MNFLINFLLISILATILTIPIVTNHFLISFSDEPGIVAGVASISEKEINILPNLTDFNGYVRFAPSQIKNGQYQDTVQLKVFQRQKASYQGLYTLYNQTLDRPLTVEITTTGVNNSVAFSQILLMISQNQPAWVVPESIQLGSTLIRISDLDQFLPDQKLIVGQELTEIVAVSTDGLIVT